MTFYNCSNVNGKMLEDWWDIYCRIYPNQKMKYIFIQAEHLHAENKSTITKSLSLNVGDQSISTNH